MTQSPTNSQKIFRLSIDRILPFLNEHFSWLSSPEEDEMNGAYAFQETFGPAQEPNARITRVDKASAQASTRSLDGGNSDLWKHRK